MEHETFVSTDPGRHGHPSAPVRGHRTLAHTADVGLEAWAPDAGSLLEEAAHAVADISADVTEDIDAGASRSLREELAVEAADAEGLVFAWLNELIGLVDARGAAIAAIAVHDAGFEGRPRARATLHLVPFDGLGVRRRNDVKSATYHQLAVRHGPHGWSLVAYLDI